MKVKKYEIHFVLGGVPQMTVVDAVNIVGAMKKFNCSETFPRAVVEHGYEVQITRKAK